MANNLQLKNIPYQAPSAKNQPGRFEWLSPNTLAHAHDWWDIYTKSFPPEERDTREQLLLSLHKNIALIGCYRIQNSMAAIVVLYRMQNPAFSFLHYFAVTPAWRNKQLGSTLFPMIVTEAEKHVLQKNSESLGLIWEVEDPEKAITAFDRDIQTRRINFYHKLGGKLFKTRFIQPSINNHNAVPMRLMAYSNQGTLMEKQIAKAIYYQKYQIINGADDQQLTELLNQCHVSSVD
jgi:GNAT superfamily N-acetyltransferase